MPQRPTIMIISLRAEVVGEQSRTALEARYISKQNHPSSTLFAELGRSAGFVNCDNNRGLRWRSEEHTSELQSRGHLVCRLLLEKKKKKQKNSKSERSDL